MSKTVVVPYFTNQTTTRARVVLGDVVTKQVEDIFSSGQCHALAVALHEILGWPIKGCYGSYGSKAKHTHHFVVYSPCKLTGDIFGLRCIDFRLRNVKAETILKDRNPMFLHPSMEFARHYAKLIAPEMLKQSEARLRGEQKTEWPWCHNEGLKAYKKWRAEQYA